MKGYIKIKVPFYQTPSLILRNELTKKRHSQFPYIYLAEDFSHYLSKHLMLIDREGRGLRSTIGGQKFKGFTTYYIIDQEKVFDKVKVTGLSEIVIEDHFKKDDEWFYVFNKELRLG
jgi:hypothetical protein